MCGRFTLTLEVSELQLAFDLGEQSVSWSPNYNIAPTNKIPVVTNDRTDTIELFHWGLIPSWSKDKTISAKLINARSETAHEKPSFKTPFKTKRCLIFADGFYEWKKGAYKGSKKVPYYFRMIDRKPFVFAGLWDYWPGNDQEKPVHSCTILTCNPNEIVMPVHDRMPVIFNWDQGRQWISNNASFAELRAMLNPFPANEMESYGVSSRVNNPENNSKSCIEPQHNLTFF